MLVHWTQGKISSVKYVFNKVTKRKEKREMKKSNKNNNGKHKAKQMPKLRINNTYLLLKKNKHFI